QRTCQSGVSHSARPARSAGVRLVLQRRLLANRFPGAGLDLTDAAHALGEGARGSLSGCLGQQPAQGGADPLLATPVPSALGEQDRGAGPISHAGRTFRSGWERPTLLPRTMGAPVGRLTLAAAAFPDLLPDAVRATGLRAVPGACRPAQAGPGLVP